MKIRYIYMAMFGMLMSVQMAFAQQNMVIVGSNGTVDAVSVSSVDYATFNASSKWFGISYKGISETKYDHISASVSVFLDDGNIKKLGTTPQIGVCYSKDNTTPTIDDNCLSLGSELSWYPFTLSSLISGTTYYFRAYVKLADSVFYGDVVEAQTLSHKFVDLGLPSGLLWAETNIGAETAADNGNYYAWGETEPQSSNTYTWDSYKYGSEYTNLSKYNSTDGKSVLDKEDDAAYVNWGPSYRMPTSEEFAELNNSENCTWTWTTMTASDGSSSVGFQVTSVKNGNSIFLPASGHRSEGNLWNNNWEGEYWSSSSNLSSYPPGKAVYLTLLSNGSRNQYDLFRFYGLTIRPVAEP